MNTKPKAFEEIFKKLLKNKYVLIVLLLGLVIILIPTGSSKKTEADTSGEAVGLSAPLFSVTEEEDRLQRVLEQIEGAGEVRVLLSLRSTASRELAQGEEEPLVISTGSGRQSTVELWYDYPEYLGAVIISSGASSARVKLDITQAVSAFTGLGSDKITVIKMK